MGNFPPSKGKALPTGTVTFLFTDIEGSTDLALTHPDTWETAKTRHHSILRQAIDRHNGYIFQIIGDAFCAAFHTAGDALRAAVQSQIDLQDEDWGDIPIRVRMGINTGDADLQDDGQYIGYLALSTVQRVMSIAYGGQTILSGTSAGLVRSDLPDEVNLLDLKEHRLKGMLNPEHLWQIVTPELPGEFPPLQTLTEVPNNLPLQLTSFIGREFEISEIKQALNGHRLVTLTGSGGIGKTRLSLQVADELMDSFPDGVWFLELAPIVDPGLVPYTLANLLGLRDAVDSAQTMDELVAAYFQSRKALILLDNCEHLIDACANFADLLLRSCKDLKIIATSREALGIESELSYHLPSLSLPGKTEMVTPEELSRSEAVKLFTERATLVKRHFSLTDENIPHIAKICQRLDGIPMATELAAARANVLTPEQIAQRLDDRFNLLTGGSRTAVPRQQTL
ncbi:MAG: adenylate/guanylate cyclase domain-containing protein, partial [Anaerolineales bacterium]|nr:adenylate/guanylate cyclase domain-containing protein [Anaerolineales bacterium]